MSRYRADFLRGHDYLRRRFRPVLLLELAHPRGIREARKRRHARRKIWKLILHTLTHKRALRPTRLFLSCNSSQFHSQHVRHSSPYSTLSKGRSEGRFLRTSQHPKNVPRKISKMKCTVWIFHGGASVTCEYVWVSSRI